MEMEVQIISKENVKPFSSTPAHLKFFKLSLLDQLMPSPYAPIILFYPMNKKNNTNPLYEIPSRLKLLKSSLSKTLISYYPLAGIIRDDLCIECNDQGACFVETKVNCSLCNFLTQPYLLLLNKFLPCEFTAKESVHGTCVTNIQVNVFNCGGIAVGICISHKILDGSALSTFLMGWSSVARECNGEISPKYIATSLFPANDLWLKNSTIPIWGSLLRKGNCITKRFVFDSSAISKLKSQSTISGLKCPTRVEAVTAFLWKCIVSVFTNLRGFQNPSVIIHAVNLRRRMEPSLSENSLGNLLWIAAAEYTEIEAEPKLGDLMGKVREAISRIDDEFVKKIKGDKGKFMMSESLKKIAEMASKNEVDCIGFSSWCNFGYYGADFGWGKPVWVSSIGLEGSAFMNLIILSDIKSGDGVEAWVTLDEHEMAILQSNLDLLKLVSVDPSPLLINNSVIST